MDYTISIESIVPGERWAAVASFRWRQDAVSYAKSISRDVTKSLIPGRSVRLEDKDLSYYYRDGAEFVRPAMSLDDLIWETGL